MSAGNTVGDASAEARIKAAQDARDAARARGKDRNPALLLTPAVVGAVAYAERTGEALHARGLPEDL